MDYPHTIVPGLLGVAQEYPVTVTFSLEDHVYALALNRAKTCALGRDFAEDTSQSFGTRWLSDLRENEVWAQRCLESESYLKACAENYAKHAAAVVERQRSRELGLSGVQDDDGLEGLEFQNRGPGHIANPAIREELRALLHEAISRLTSS
jgi:hypothetical protein